MHALAYVYVCGCRMCVCVCPPHLSLIQSLYSCISSIGMAGLHSVVRADAQHGAGVTT